MAHSPESVAKYVCENCHATHAGTPVTIAAGEHRFDPPASCGACSETEFVPMEKWIHRRCSECPRVVEEF